VAGGAGLGIEQRDVRINGHAIECRINAEDPANDFRPAPGRITRWAPPHGEGLRLDTHARQGYLVPPFYDSMIGKLIVSGPDRNTATSRLVQAIAAFGIEGVTTTLPLASFIASHPDFRRNEITTRWLEVHGLPAFAHAEERIDGTH
jgi:acetyl-CoA carboxylase biotin carboxylase subunit